MASVFPVSDRYFCSVLGQTYPNRRYLISAASLGFVNDTTPALTDTDPASLACDVTGPGTIPPPGSVSPPPANGTAAR